MDITHGKYLGVDYGDKRTGLAECDISGLIAGGIGTISEGGMRKTAQRVAEEAEKRSCKKIIIGLPKNMDGTEGFRAERCREFAQMLRQKSEGKLLVAMIDERLTTMSASRYLNETNTRGSKRKGVIDTLSAEIILQNALDRLKN